MEEHEEPLRSRSMAFTEHLDQELRGLEEANLRAIISSEQQVAELMSALDEALAEVARVEETLQVCDELLGAVRQQMDHIHQENSLLQRLASNRSRLMDEILFLTVQLQLSREHRSALSRADLSSPAAIRACTAAAQALSSCMDLPIHPSDLELCARQEAGGSQGCAELKGLECPNLDFLLLPGLSSSFQVYSQNLGRLYEREIKALFEQAKISLSGRRKGSEWFKICPLCCWGEHAQGKELRAPQHFPVPPSPRSLLGQSLRLSLCSPCPLRWAQSCSGVPSESQRVPRPKVVSQQVLEQVLRELQPLCTSEQQFLQEFFCLGCGSVELEVRVSLTPDLSHDLVWFLRPEEATTQLLSELFSCLEPELRAFLDVCSKAHPLGCLQVLVTLSDSVFGTWGPCSAPPSSFLHNLLENVLLLAKGNFNKCIVSEMEEAKAASRTTGGILPCVSRFQELVALSEEVFQTSQRWGELDKAQLRLASSVFSSSECQANLRVNTDMVMMENFHHIHNFLCQRNIPCLEGKKREAKQRSREHMEKYITTYVGQPLERLKHFFEGVKARLAQGVKEEEVSFQLAYSKQELRKVIEKYPGKEVKRALESLYRTIQKQLSPEENLLPVVWQAMEQGSGFIQQYREFEELIQCCYAGAGIALDFTMEDLLSYFNSITMSNM
uniref:Exocyst complex component 1 n=1 Tax=Serinus canaria TaxID=9135 RepID=A0A8C9NMY1_SERCA